MIKQACIAAIKAYQRITGLFSVRNCRFHPSCSQYAIDAFEQYGVAKAIAKSFWRIMRCSPFSQGGHDPVR